MTNLENIEKTILNYAIDYLQRKFSIIPLGPRSKTPSVSSWEEYQKLPAEIEQIKNWFFDKNVNNNIAIITGNISSIVAFDIDGEEAQNYFWKVIEDCDQEIKNAVKTTLKIKTGAEIPT